MKKKFKKTKKNKGFSEIYGIHSSLAALNNSSRKNQKLVVSSQNEQKFRQFRQRVSEFIIMNNKQMNKIYGNEKNHQGVYLLTSKIIQPSIEELINRKKKSKFDIIVILDQVTDPQNIGSIVRSCSLLNCDTIIVSKKNSPEITPSMVKAASGGIEKVNYIKVNNIKDAITKLKKIDYFIIGFDEKNNQEINKIKFPKKVIFIFGAENKGLKNSTKQQCNLLTKIPIIKDLKYNIESLNVSNACSIALYEFYKKIYR
ncbi:MAG: putative TrmH family tRNA/rRNA methyltransferase [Alphaproteobacteria bacterium MarineAlpha5_Bin9]|nr:MAG: putative TrmH family tRNA/rRNA methyltransferase [Alphaproteobacteria bacterium MarineAlpha5_Bin9]|tara:strand:- start:12234 stop:13004 length:771 start_codon:yes stop_codon:yes gene_type:complete